MKLRAFFAACSFAALATITMGCGDTGSGDNTGGNGAGANTSSGGANSGGSTGSFTDDQFDSIKIDPPDALITVDNGVIPAATQFTLKGVKADGSEVAIQGTWTFTRPDVAATDGGGAVTATGLLGGKGKLTATYQTLTASADVTVKLVITDDPLSLDPNIKDLFDNATTPDPALTIAYPYDQTVFPRGTLGPVLQWTGGSDTDIYRIHAQSETFEFTSWANVLTAATSQSMGQNPGYPFPQAPQDVWKLLVGSTDGNVDLSIQRYDGATAYTGKTEQWKVAPANLAGTIYYWEINQGNVVRLKVGDTAPQSFIQKPPGVTCVACHSVSANGSTLVAGFHGGYSPWGTFNTADGSSIYATDAASGFEAISPDGAFVVYGQSNNTTTMTLSNSNNLTSLATLVPTNGGAPTHPSWSVDGKKIAYGVRTDGNWLDFNTSSLYVADVDTTTPAITNQVEIVPVGSPLTTTTYPSWTPDSKWIAFMRANQARTRGALGEVWLVGADGSAAQPLTSLNGTNYLPAPQNQASYQPTFLPVAVGGYFWVVFESERTYGTTLTDTNPASRRKQLWVAAINADPQAGSDPSHPAFWLPGQELSNQNMRGAWSLDPCKPDGSDCSAGFECCNGFCSYDQDQMKYVCEPPTGCSPDGSICTMDSDCCGLGATCVGGYCSGVPQ